MAVYEDLIRNLPVELSGVENGSVLYNQLVQAATEYRSVMVRLEDARRRMDSALEIQFSELVEGRFGDLVRKIENVNIALRREALPKDHRMLRAFAREIVDILYNERRR